MLSTSTVLRTVLIYDLVWKYMVWLLNAYTNTSDMSYSYCNSIVQALYYSVPFRENVVRYPPLSPHDTPVTPIRAIQNGGALSPTNKPKGLSAAEAMKRRQAINSGQNVPPSPGQRAEDKPDSPEYKKKHAMLAGPILELTYENASAYDMEESSFTALKDMFMAVIANSSRTGVLSPQRFLEIFKRENESFRNTLHQDAHEFYGIVLNSVITNVEENALRTKDLAPPADDLTIDQSMRSAVTSAAKSMGLPSGMRSPGSGWVHDIFEGVLTSETKCLTCEMASQRDETFLDLSIDLDENSSVTSCLRKFSAEEMLCERNKFHCDNCGGLQEAEKRMKIKKLPKILTLHLKRFKYTEDQTRLEKLFHRVVYPYHLRMFNTTDDAEDPDRLYELYAVVIHIGANAYHGHYVSVIKTQDRGWLLFDDEMVEPVDKHYVRNFFGDKPGTACAYVLFYQETTFEAMRKEQEAEGLAEVELAAAEAEAALNKVPNGSGPPQSSSYVPTKVQNPITPIDEHKEFVSLDHAATAPVPMSPPAGARTFPNLHPIISATNGSDGTKSKSKEEKEREKKEAKEAEKAKKIADKERIKADEKKRKEADAKLKEQNRLLVEESKRVMAASKVTAAEEEEKRKREAATAAAPVPAEASKENGTGIPPLPDKKVFGSLSRNNKGSISMSRKSFGFLNKNGNGEAKANEDTAVEGDTGPQTPEKYQKSTKDRFSFGGLGRKKSNLMNSS